MARGAIRGLLLAGALVLGAMAGTPAHAVFGDGGGVPIEMTIMTRQPDGKATLTAIFIQGATWLRLDGELEPNLESGEPNPGNEGTFSSETVADIRKLVSATDFVVQPDFPTDSEIKGASFHLFKVNANKGDITHIVLGDGYPAGEGSFAKLVKLLNEETTRPSLG
ncbi:MAG: hypothetical protein H0T78_12850 [Longispora sp.]|nr:hypothetical protein [Longispora sp. (in: high G+C Gram-positive bacteria)]